MHRAQNQSFIEKNSFNEIEGSKLMMKRNDEFILIEGKFPRINTNKNEERLKKAVDLLKKF